MGVTIMQIPDEMLKEIRELFKSIEALEGNPTRFVDI